ncbi:MULTISPECIES: DUF1656 domain-containing protein [Rhodopseudomonas]|uniref:Membrane protein n=1 Tax=Rhodopseudomonas palustris TaxID=1076 RepID=A0A0D7EF71_RHOPL|nr:MULTISPECIES: DUF1656 domain-containing protein [Rhodopseudomonas]KIZ38197.1 membrane protein [Rhodopseudomonas palustris]MDF3812854.1 DUF1656 domain-containing protein [Rhodopseudomonas sp. BAL398]WOK15740.1 DUF1656 domain-containing protein [Rhodopseudomonas sp. BAL398]
MTRTFQELVIDDVMIAPFVSYLVVALIVFLLIRPLARRAGFELVFSHPPVAECSLFIIILASLIAFF